MTHRNSHRKVLFGKSCTCGNTEIILLNINLLTRYWAETIETDSQGNFEIQLSPINHKTCRGY